MNRKVLSQFVILSALALGACASAPLQTALPVVGSAEAGDYRIGAGDALRVVIYNEANLSGPYNVNAAGKISMPLVGAIDAAGLTAGELQAAISQKYKSGGFLENPVAVVDIVTYRPYFILGEVNAPGAYPFVPGMTVQQAVATAKGFTYRARTSVLELSHWGQSKADRYPLVAGAIVQPGDTIRIEERHF